MTNIEVFRPKSSLVISFIGYFLVSGALIQSIATSNFREFFLTFIVTAPIVLFIYCVIQRPRLEIADEGVVLVNPLSTKRLKWGDVLYIETRFALTFHTESGSVTSWAAIAPSRYHHRTVDPNELRGIFGRDAGSIKASDSPRTDSGAAAYIARQRWENFKRKRHY